VLKARFGFTLPVQEAVENGEEPPVARDTGPEIGTKDDGVDFLYAVQSQLREEMGAAQERRQEVEKRQEMEQRQRQDRLQTAQTFPNSVILPDLEGEAKLGEKVQNSVDSFKGILRRSSQANGELDWFKR